MEICKEKKKNLNPEQPITTNQQNSMKTKTKKLKSIATHNHKHKLTKFHEQLKRIKREQYIENNERKSWFNYLKIKHDGLD